MREEERYCYKCRSDQSFNVLSNGENFEAWGSSHVVARESSHVEARESSHVEAWESSHVVARGRSHVVASKFNSVTIHGRKIHARGGVQIKIPEILTLKGWCDYYGVVVKRGIATVFKGVNDNFNSPKGGVYTPGTKPEALDWDGGKAECGGGFHFSPHPLMTLQYNSSATRFIACPVKLSDCRKPGSNDQYPNKIKARRVCAPCYEVDRYGNPVK